MITCAAPAIKFLQANVMSPDPDSENVNRIWSGSPLPSGMPTLHAVYGVLPY